MLVGSVTTSSSNRNSNTMVLLASHVLPGLFAFVFCRLQLGSQAQQDRLQPLFAIKRGHPSAHRYQVTSVVWYPVDTGLFVSGSADQDVKVSCRASQAPPVRPAEHAHPTLLRLF